VKDKFIRAAVKWLMLAAALFLALFITANILIRQPGIQAYFLRQISRSTGYEVSAESIFVSLRRGPSLHVLQVLIATKDGNSLSIPELYLSLDGSSLFSGRFIPTSVTLIGPRIVLDDEIAGIEIPAESRQEPEHGGHFLGYLYAVLSQVFNYYPISLSELTFENAAVAVKGLQVEARMIKGAIYAHDSDILEIKLGGAIVSDPDRSSFFHISGTLSRETTLNALPSLEASIDLMGFPEDILNSDLLSVVKQDGAEASLRMKTTGEGDISFECSIRARRLYLHLDKGDKQIDVAGVEANFTALLDDKGLSVTSLSVRSNGVRVEGEGYIRIESNRAVSLRLILSSPPISVVSAREVVPAFLYPDMVGEEILPLVSHGTVRLEKLLLDGSLEKLRNIEKNPGVLFLKLSWSDLELFEGKSSPAMSGISGELLFEKGELYISGLNGSWGESYVDECSMNLAEVYGTHRYAFSGHLGASTKDMASLRRLKWFPEEAKEAISWFSTDRGTLDMRLSLRMDSGRKNFSIEKAELFLNNCVVEHPKFPFEVNIRRASALMQKNDTWRFSLSALSADSIIDASGSYSGWGMNTVVKATVSLDISPEEALKRLSQNATLPIKAEKRLPASINLSINGPAVSCKGSLNLEGLSARFPDIVLASKGKEDRLDFAFKLNQEKGLLIEAANFMLGSSVLKIRTEPGLKYPGADIILLKSERFFLGDIGFALGEDGRKPSGLFAFDIKAPLPAGLLNIFRMENASGSPISPIIKEAVGRAEGSLISIPSGILPIPIEDGGFIVRFSEEGMKIDYAAFRTGKSNFSIKVDISRYKGIKCGITLLDGFLDMSDFTSLFAKETLDPDRAHDLPEDMDIEIKVAALRGLWRDVFFGPLAGNASVSEGMINITGLSGPAGSLEIDLQAAFRGKKSPRISISGTLKADGKPAGGVLSMAGFEPDHMEGPLSLSADFATHGDGTDDLLCHLSGDVDLEIGKGTIRKSHVLLSILRFLSIENIFSRPPPDLSREGLYFDGIQGAFMIDNGIISTEDLIMQSPVINVASTGSFDLATGTVKAEMVVQPFGTLDSIAGRIPLLGYILTGNDRTLVLYYFHVEGHLREPSVSYVPFKNLGSGAVGILHRLILTPRRILKKLSRTVRSMEDGRPLSPDEDPERVPLP